MTSPVWPERVASGLPSRSHSRRLVVGGGQDAASGANTSPVWPGGRTRGVGAGRDDRGHATVDRLAISAVFAPDSLSPKNVRQSRVPLGGT